MTKNLHSVFICSSSRAVDVAEAIQTNLFQTCNEVEVWSQGAFAMHSNILDELRSFSNRFTHVILILTPDSLLNNENVGHLFAPVDNVIFELGFFLGVLGRERTSIVHENSSGLKLPAYLGGMILGQFIRPAAGANLNAALVPACAAIKNRLNFAPLFSQQVDTMIVNTLKMVCCALSSPASPDNAKLRAFVFKKIGSNLVCTQFWAPYATTEGSGLTFAINDETQKQVAVVKAATRRQAVAVTVEPLPDHMNGVEGNVDKDLCFILAAPIQGPYGVWGTVDFDASNKTGQKILSSEMAANVLYMLGRHLYNIITK